MEVQRIFPQTLDGFNNRTPIDAINTSNFYTNGFYGPIVYPPMSVPTTPVFQVCDNFASEETMEGLTYSFDCENARFVLIDQFTKPSGVSHSNLNQTDIDWIGERLSESFRPAHAFTFAHKHLISENHNDTLFGSVPDVAGSTTGTSALTNSFMSYLYNNGVRYHFGGHDHMHNRAIITSPDGLSEVQNIITSSNSYKFYIPPSMTALNSQPWRSRENQIAQELFTVGYYIVTVDGPKVSVDFYAMPNGCNGDCDQTYDVIPYVGNTPTAYPHDNPTVIFNAPVPFTKHETFGYSLNGIEKLVAQGKSYELTDDTDQAISNGETGYLGTMAAILDGTNGSIGKDFSLRALTKSVNTGWSPKDNDLLDSDILTLWGMADSLATDFTDTTNSNLNYKYVVPNTTLTDTYVLSMTYRPGHSEHLGNGGFGIATKNDMGDWINAVNKNEGGTKTFVKGPWKKGYGLGTYGVDASTKTAWAVINCNGDFAVANDIEPVPGQRK